MGALEPFAWPDEAIVQLKALFDKGESDAGMARALSEIFNTHVTRSSVIGKRHRLGLTVDHGVVKARKANGHRSCAMASGSKRAKYQRQPAHRDDTRIDKSEWNKPAEPRPPRTLPAVVHNITMKAEQGIPVRDFSLDIPGFECVGVALVDLGTNDCRRPLDAGNFCGNPRQDFDKWFPYCGHHASLARKKA